MATRHNEVLHPVLTNKTVDESIREPMMPNKDNDTSNFIMIS